MLQPRGKRTITGLLLLVGVSVTAIVTGLDRFGALDFLERRLYDARIQQFQYFTPPPSPRLIHFDIDENSLNSIGRWPWPRLALARMFDELRQADAKVVFTDIILSEPDRAYDKTLGEAAAKYGRALIPISINQEAPRRYTRAEQRMLTELRTDITLDATTLTARLRAQGFTDVTLDADVGRAIGLLRKAAARDVVKSYLLGNPDLTLPQLRPIMLPRLKDYVTANPELTLLAEIFETLRQERAVERFTRSIPGSITDLPEPQSVNAPVVPLSTAAAYSGFVEYLNNSEEDGTVRMLQLGVNYHGRFMPSVALALAAAMEDVPIDALVITPTSVTLPTKGRRPTVIPVHTFRAVDGRVFPMVMDIPWFGGPTWETMYDYPRYKRPLQRESLLTIQNVLATQDRMTQNESSIETVVTEVFASLGESAIVDAYKAMRTENAPDEDRRTFITGVVDSITDYVDQATARSLDTARSAADRTADARLAKSLAAAQRRARDGIDEWAKLGAQLGDLRAALRAKVAGKGVLIGFTATGAIDRYSTPLHSVCPGVMAHGTAASGILTGHLWRRAPPWVTLAVIALAGLVLTLVMAYLPPWVGGIVASVLFFGYVIVTGLVLFDAGGVIVGAAGPLICVASVWTLMTIARYTQDLRERNRITRRFRSYVDPQLVNYVLAHPEQDIFTGEERHMSVAFTDLENFTTLSERLGTETVQVLSAYMGVMVPVITARRGFVNKFLGDGIMFFFNAPDPNANHPADAVATALQMQSEMTKFNVTLAERNLPLLKTRVGIITGNMVVGDAGPAQRSDFTVLGDNVNLASRLEGANKVFGSQILCEEVTAKLAGDKFVYRPIALLRVKGKEKAVPVVEPLCVIEEADDHVRTLVGHTEAVVASYRAGRFTECLTAVTQMEAYLGVTKLTALYQREATRLLAEPPGDAFDGSISLTEK